MTTNDIALREGATPASYDPEFARLQAQRDVIKAQIMPENSTDDELEVFMATCVAQGLDPFMGQIIAIRPDAKTKDGKPTGAVKPFRTWEGLVAIAERTGEYQGRVGPLWTADGREWLEVWLDEENPPKAAKVGIWRKGFREPVWGIATLAAWGMQEEYDDERDKQGKPVVRQGKYGPYTKRVKTGKRNLKPGWWEMPQTPHQLAKVAFTIALKSSFQPQMLRRATKEIDAEVVDGALPASRDQIVRLHASTPGSLQGSRNRDRRLGVASMYLRRPVRSYNDLSSDEASELADWFDQVGEDYEEIIDVEVETDADVDYTEALEQSIEAVKEHQVVAPAAQADPALSSAPSGPADSSAGAKPEACVLAPLPACAPAEPPSDKGRNPDSEPAGQGEVGDREAPASPARPKRKGTKPGTGMPVAQAMREAQEFRDGRKQQEVPRPYTRWLHTIPLEAKKELLDLAGGRHQLVEDKANLLGQTYGKALETWTDADDWKPEELAALKQEVTMGGEDA